jgi:choline dehydrogenase-like flavoprotein
MLNSVHLPVLAEGGRAEEVVMHGRTGGLPTPAAPAEPGAAQGLLSNWERDQIAALARAVIPAGAVLSGAGAQTVPQVESLLTKMPRELVTAYRAMLMTFAGEARARHGRPLAALSPAEIEALCQRYHNGGWSRRNLLRTLLTPIKLAYFDDPAVFQRLGCAYGVPPGARAELPRHVRERTLAGADVPPGEVLECDAVVIGSGAGGAVAARELAEAGHAVVLLEEGEYHSRADFTGHVLEMQRKLYRDMGGTVAVGNTVIPVPIGRSVGGTTTINSGTCYRAPGRVLRKWREGLGLTELTDEEMGRLYERVEGVLQVSAAPPAYLGGVARVIARGADALGYRHRPLLRNAPACDGQGLCCFGCPTDAKRSTNVSYVPLALRAGAQLITGARVESLIIEGGRAVGARVATAAGGFAVRARAVVVAAGALMTPVLLLSDRGARAALAGTGQLGANLTIHPALAVFALMPGEAVRAYAAIPQGYAIEEFHEEGILMEGVGAPLDLGSISLLAFGRRFTELMESYDRIAAFGFMLEEESRGRVRPGPRGRPLITYSLVDADVARLKRGVEILSRIFFAAGAEAVLPQVAGFDELRDSAELAGLRRARLRARDFALTAYHPLGTARMGRDRRSSVVGVDGQAHDLPGLYICDGSVLPTSPAVNPQLTIMALCTRVAQNLAARL